MMSINELKDFTSTEDLNKKLRDYAINYLIECGFVDALVKKSLFREDIGNYYEDFLQETWLAILEQDDEKWVKLYRSAEEKGVEYEYEIRNYVSRIVLNTVKSTSSNAYRKIKKPSVREKTQESTKWDILAQQLTEPKDIIQQIAELNNR